MHVLQLILTLPTMLVPGFALLRRARWSDVERLVGAVAMSLISTFLVGFLVFAADLPVHIYTAWTVMCWAGALLLYRDLRSFFRREKLRRALVAYGMLLAWCLALQITVRNYGGALWTGDWLEHYQRSVFFLHRLPTEFRFLGGYLLPARPPMMNVLCAFYMAESNDAFPFFQCISTILNTLVFLSLYALLPWLLPGVRMAPWRVAAALMLNPMMMQNATFTWTKLLAVFFSVAAVAFYRRALSKRDGLRLLVAVLAMSAGVLVHYSAAVVAVLLVIHAGALLLKGRFPMTKSIPTALLAGGALFGTWLMWSLQMYGATGTFASNTSVTDAVKAGGPVENLRKIIGNEWDTLVPFIFRPTTLAEYDAAPQHPLGVLRDGAFLVYQVNAIFSIGATGFFLLTWHAWKNRHQPRPPQWRWWTGFLVGSVVLGVAVSGDRDHFGLMHLCSQHVTFILSCCVALLAAQWSAAMRALLALGLLLDFALGILLHFTLQHPVLQPNGDVVIFGQELRLNKWILINWNSKQLYGIEFLGDVAPVVGDVLLWMVTVVGVALIVRLDCGGATLGHAMSHVQQRPSRGGSQ